MKTRSIATVAAAALAAAALVAGINAATHTRTTAAATAAAVPANVPADVAANDRAAAAQGLPPRANADVVPDLSDADLALARAIGWDVTVQTPVGRLTAEEKANRHAAVGMMHADIAGLSLARVTIHGYGDPIDPDKDPATDADLRLKVNGGVYFVAVARNAPIPIKGRPGVKTDAAAQYQDVIMLIQPGKDRPDIIRSLDAES